MEPEEKAPRFGRPLRPGPNPTAKPFGFGVGDIPELKGRRALHIGWSGLDACSNCGRDVETAWINGPVAIYDMDYVGRGMSGMASTPYGHIEKPDRYVELHLYLCYECLCIALGRVATTERRRGPRPSPNGRPRTPMTNRVRFAVLERDGFRCRYCGAAPPDVVLEIDHIMPVSQGGGDEMDNLCAACVDCNRGKADRQLRVMDAGEQEERR